MLYCPVCQTLLKEGETACPNCKNKKYREVCPNDPVLLVKANEMDSDRIFAVLQEHEIPYEERMDNQAPVSSVYIGRTAYAYKCIYVPYAALEQSKTLLEAIGVSLQEEEVQQEDRSHEADTMSRGKRFVVRVISAVLFILLVWAVVTAVDSLVAFVKDALAGSFPIGILEKRI